MHGPGRTPPLDASAPWYRWPCLTCGSGIDVVHDSAVTCERGHRTDRGNIEQARALELSSLLADSTRPLAAGQSVPAGRPANRATERSARSSSSSPALDDGDDDDELRPLRRKKILTLGEVRLLYTAEVEWLVEEYIAKREITLIVGAQESLKSWGLADLARAVLSGGRWLGRFQVPQGQVVYIEAERASNLVYQTNLLQRAYGAELRDLLVMPPGTFWLRDRDSQLLLRQVVEDKRPTLVVINSFRSVFRGKAADGIEIADAMGWLGQLAEELGLAVVMVDQTNKAGATGLVRGTAAHADSLQKEYEADAVLHVERERDAVGRGTGPARVYVGKRRAGPAGPAFSFEMRKVGDGDAPIWVAEVGAPEASREPTSAIEKVAAALDHAQGPRSIEDLAKDTDLAPGTVKNQLTELKKSGRTEQDGRGAWRSSSSSSPSPRGNDDDDDEQNRSDDGDLQPEIRGFEADQAEALAADDLIEESFP